ncbi:MAG: anti-sigma-K factor RskA [Acidimicrobiales bacterium]|jgi:anti-sigma-K factor RskA
MNVADDDNSNYSDDDIMAMARDVEAHDSDRIAPPPQVWNNILAELEIEVAPEEASTRSQTTHSKTEGWFSSARLLSIAAATLVMVGVVVAIVNVSYDDSSLTEVAAASMTDEGLQVATSATADARLVCEDDDCFVDVVLSALPDAGAGDLELWVINSDVSDMYSLGNVTASNGRFALPPGVTSNDFPIVDISIEPDDGNETHSGQSVLRGVFDQSEA